MEQDIQPLNPIAIEFGPFSVHWYGIIIGLGIALALYIAMREGNKHRLDKETFPDLLIWAIPISIICARIYYVIFQWDYYSQNLGDIIKVWEGGIAIHGALIGAVATAIVFSKFKGISFWKIADIAAPSLILGQAIGRWGNFMNQEAYGGEVSRAFLENMHLPEFIINQMYIKGTYYHPTFLYESVWDIVGFILLILLRKVNLHRGELFLSYVIFYSIGRFFVEGMRMDSLMLTSSLKMAQVISLVLIAGAVVLWIYRRKAGFAKARYNE
ncbi:prolipoprotein diacylglyceryl transferase [Bacillus norwichensis]|uniref:Phosphatidylglycerol--prolipoprotein diacylglyceryl transferase n=1 Tax=Bacillus norwichensis TaxID=2762217 RepID=A0ABR8VIM1_9BACI|nr:prolipoprotein diacylglyceryl transferase [Bacillus norwichensis]MBD8004578.1 prolipoprotein diacylglyceryl transferase [Bacillus norwichensis]